jgi:hypothetical protein
MNWFPESKDPDDDAWYLIPFSETLLTLVNVVAEAGLTNQGVDPGPYAPVESGTPLVVSQAQLSTDSKGVKFRVSGGVPGTLYPIRATVITADGSTINNTRALPVAWR